MTYITNFARNNQRLLLTLLVLAVLFFGFRSWRNRDVVAYVNGRPLKIKHQIDKVVERLKKKDPNRFAGIEGPQREQDFKKQLVETKILRELQVQAAEQVGLTASEAEIDKYIEETKANIKKAKQSWADYLADQGLAEAEFREEARKNVLAAKWVKYVIKTVPKVTDGQAKQYYDRNKGYQDKPFEQVKDEIKTTIYFEMQKNTMYNTHQALREKANIYNYY